jgi:hypothetical protein
MAKKLIFAMLLSLLVSVQALAASCDIRCSSMEAMTGHASSQTHAHCHAVSAKSGKETTLTATDSCATTPCATDLKAIKNASRSDANSGKLLLSAVALLTDPFQNISPAGATSLTLASRSGGRPLAQRPGSALRI